MKQTELSRIEMPVYPHCDRCGAQMRLYGIEPHPTIDRVDLHTYACPRCDAVQTDAAPLLH